MNKQELIKAVAVKAELNHKQAVQAVDAAFQAIEEALVKGEKVSIMGFGTFDIKERAPRTGINPATKEKIEIAASKAPVFKAGKQLKEKIK